jgi:hypothetical protein
MARRLLFSVALFAGSFVFAVGSSGCASNFPPGSFDWSHGAAPLPEGATRVQVGGGGGAGLGVTDLTGGFIVPAPELGLIGGAGGGVALENQFAPTLLLRVEANGGCQTPTFTNVSDADLQLICPTAAYVGGQWNPGGNRNLALRLRGGGGGDLFVAGVDDFLPVPYMAAQVGVVASTELGSFEPYLDLHGGAKLGLALAPVASVGASGGSTWEIVENVSAYALLRTDFVLIGLLPTMTANAQVGAFFTF